ncbi:MAG: hypothetical protein ABI675_25115 [Chitinophagaceae bacterium]
MKSAFFPAELQTGGIGGCIIQGEGYETVTKGFFSLTQWRG